MTTTVAATTRDAWADATQVATQQVLDPEVAAVRRRAWLRRAVPIAAAVLALTAAYLVLNAIIGVEAAVTPVWDAPAGFSEAGLGLMGLGLVLTIVSNVRSSAAGLDLSFLGPVDLLPRTGRASVRQQISAGTAVPGDRRAVVARTAQRMSDRGRTVLIQVGQVCLLVGIALGSLFPLSLVFMGATTVWTLVMALRIQHWSRLARRWLAQHG